jgi:hypothetical protein
MDPPLSHSPLFPLSLMFIYLVRKYTDMVPVSTLPWYIEIVGLSLQITKPCYLVIIAVSTCDIYSEDVGSILSPKSS